MKEKRTLTVSNISCSRNNHELFLPVTFDLTAGEFLHIRGPNGIGKSTLLRCLATLVNPSQGEISWCHTKISESHTYKSMMMFLGHQGAVKACLTVFENLKWTASSEAPPSNEQVDLALVKLELSSLRQQLGSTLSSGQKQKLSLAKLFLGTTSLWILDEPFNSLDSKSVKLVTELMQGHLEVGGMIIFTSHQPLNDINSRVLDLIPC